METVPETTTDEETPLPLNVLTCMTARDQNDLLRLWRDTFDEFREQGSAHSAYQRQTEENMFASLDSLNGQLRSEIQRDLYNDAVETAALAIDAAGEEGFKVGLRLGAAMQDSHSTRRPLCFLNLIEAVNDGTQWHDQWARDRRLV